MNEGMVCANCGKVSSTGLDGNGCKSCLVKAALKEMFFKSICPLALAAILLLLGAAGASVLAQSSLKADFLLTTLVLAGIPFGMNRMWIILVPTGHNAGMFFCILIFDFIIGGIIGMFVLAWRVICAAFGCVKSIILLIQIALMPV